MNRTSYVADRAAATALGAASIGIGLMELAAPQVVEKMLGLKDTTENRGILRTLGVRELMHGAAIFANGSKRKLAVGVWARVGGDVLDTALLGMAARKTKNTPAFAATTAVVTAIGLADLVVAKRLSEYR